MKMVLRRMNIQAPPFTASGPMRPSILSVVIDSSFVDFVFGTMGTLDCCAESIWPPLKPPSK